MQCPICETQLEEFAEVDLDGETWSFARCARCGFEMGSAGCKLSPEEMSICEMLRRQLKNREGASIG